MGRPELNGQCGVVDSWDEQNERWNIRTKDGTGKAFYARNLVAASTASVAAAEEALIAAGEEFSAGQRVQVVGLNTRSDLLGQEATVVMQDPSDNKRWRVRMDDGSG